MPGFVQVRDGQSGLLLTMFSVRDPMMCSCRLTTADLSSVAHKDANTLLRRMVST
jgi:hypothetical protein